MAKKPNENLKDKVRLSEAAAEFAKEEAKSIEQASKFERKLLDMLGQQAITSQILNDLQKKGTSEFQETSKFLRESNDILKESVKDMANTLGLSHDLTANQQRGLELEEEKAKYIRAYGEAGAKNLVAQIVASQRQLKQADALDIIQRKMHENLGGSLNKIISMGKFIRVGGMLAVGFLAISVIVAGIGLGFGLVVKLITKAWEMFTFLDDAASDFRNETGLTRIQVAETVELARQLHGEYARYGVTAENVYEVAKNWRDVFSSAVSLSETGTRFMSLWAVNLGISEQASSRTLANIMGMSGASEDVALSTASLVASLSVGRGVSPAEVFANIAESTSAINLYMRGNKNLMVASAIESRRLGLNLSEVAESAESLLNFESSISSEMKASALLGQQINFGQARRLAFEGDILGAREEVMSTIRQTGDFLTMNVFQKRALAEAAGMTVDEITNQLRIEKALGGHGTALTKTYESLTEEMKKRVDLGSITLEQDLQQLKGQQEMMSEMEKIKTAWRSIFIQFAMPFTELITKEVVPQIGDMVRDFTTWMGEMGGFEVVAERLGETFQTIWGTIDAGVKALQWIHSTFGGPKRDPLIKSSRLIANIDQKVPEAERLLPPMSEAARALMAPRSQYNQPRTMTDLELVNAAVEVIGGSMILQLGVKEVGSVLIDNIPIT